MSIDLGLQLLQTIALLCQMSLGNRLVTTDEDQLMCQKYYVDCSEKFLLRKFTADEALTICIKERKL
jgi:hypothetical protein